MSTGIVFNIQRFSLHDGPGIRTTVFLKGCPLTCSCCHNPESQDRAAEVVFHEARCLRCGACVAACTTGALDAPGARPDPARCQACGACAEACPSAAREWVGREMSAPEVLAEAARDRPFYEVSGGGVTFSGGEPLLQIDFLEALLRGCRERGLPTALDTCGHAPWADLERVRGLVDLFLYDLKTLDDARHQAFTGLGNTLILDNLRELARRGGAVVLRVPVVPGLNDDDESWQALGAFAAALPGLRGVDLLPYHRLGADKYVRLGRCYPLADTPPPAAERLAAMAAALRGRGLAVTAGG